MPRQTIASLQAELSAMTRERDMLSHRLDELYADKIKLVSALTFVRTIATNTLDADGDA